QFYNGATVVLEGPAELMLISRTEAYCAHGKLRASVPPQAKGFSIGAPQLSLVDRGTEFGLSVGADDKTEVHVFQGKVELDEPRSGPYDPGAGRLAKAPKELKTGEGVRVEGAGVVRKIASDPAAFQSSDQLEARLRREAVRRHRDWLAASEEIRKDPSLVVYYSFRDGPATGRTLSDE